MQLIEEMESRRFLSSVNFGEYHGVLTSGGANTRVIVDLQPGTRNQLTGSFSAARIGTLNVSGTLANNQITLSHGTLASFNGTVRSASQMAGTFSSRQLSGALRLNFVKSTTPAPATPVNPSATGTSTGVIGLIGPANPAPVTGPIMQLGFGGGIDSLIP